MKKRLLSLVLVLVMVLTMIPIGNIAASASSYKTLNEAVAWLNSQVGKQVGSGQCVAFIQAYYVFLGASTPYGNGCDYATNSLPSGWQRIKGATPQTGDILVWTQGYENYGHVAIYGGGNNYYHQNWSGTYVQILNNAYTNGFSISSGKYYANYWGVIRPAFGNAPSPVYSDITEGDYYIKNNGTGKYLDVEGGYDNNEQNIIVYEFGGSKNQTYAITKSTSVGGYMLRPHSSAYRVVNVYASIDKIVSGKNVCIYDNVIDGSQRWHFEKVSGGYVIRNVQNPSVVLDVEANNNVCVKTYSGAKTQIWTLVKKCSHSYSNACDASCNKCGATRSVSGHSYNAATCTKAKTCKYCGAKSGTALGHRYSNSCDKACNYCSYTRVTEHRWVPADCTTPATCYVCYATIGNTTGHKYSSSCDSTCNYCGQTRTVNHTYKTTTTKATLTKNGSINKTCTKCGYSASKTVIKYAKTVKLSATSYTYNGKVKKPSVIVKDSAGKTISKSNYTVSYAKGRKNVGTYKVTVKFKGNYSGTKTLTFKINPINVSKCKIKLSATSYTYNGKVKKPAVTVKSPSGSKISTSSYTVSYAKGRKNVGTYKVTVKMKGNYAGTKTLTFKINPPKTSVSKLTAGKKALTVSVAKKSSQVSGYQIQYSTSKKFTSAKTKTISSYKTTKATLKSLKAKKTYYVRVRTYKTVSGKKYYSAWSTYKYKKTK